MYFLNLSKGGPVEETFIYLSSTYIQQIWTFPPNNLDAKNEKNVGHIQGFFLLWWFSVGRFDYVQRSALIGGKFICKKNPLQDLLSSLNAVISTNERHWIITGHGGFQLLDLIIPELKSHVIPYKFKSSHWLKLQFRLESKSCKGFFLQINFQPMRDLGFLTGHVTFKLRYNQI